MTGLLVRLVIVGLALAKAVDLLVALTEWGEPESWDRPSIEHSAIPRSIGSSYRGYDTHRRELQ